MNKIKDYIISILNITAFSTAFVVANILCYFFIIFPIVMLDIGILKTFIIIFLCLFLSSIIPLAKQLLTVITMLTGFYFTWNGPQDNASTIYYAVFSIWVIYILLYSIPVIINTLLGNSQSNDN